MNSRKKPPTCMSPEEFCPVRHTIRILGKRWTILIIKEIFYSNKNSLGFMDIKKRLTNISAKVLSERLKEMEEDSLVKRRVFSKQTPLRVYYSLTEKGHDACTIVGEFKKYGLKWGTKKTFDCSRIDCELCAQMRNSDHEES
ncbi:MAG: helix-turn-helix domain-containing protein [Methanobacteriota archaeon]